MKKLQVSLPDDLREKLDAVVAKSGNSLGEEIRQRLERTIEQDALDPITAELVLGVINIAAEVQRSLGARWHDYVELHGAFGLALSWRLDGYKPPEQRAAFMRLAQDMGWSDQVAGQVQTAPDVLGTMIERADRRANTYEHLQRLQEARHQPAPLSRMRKPKGEDK
jgi:hypothetical protein